MFLEPNQQPQDYEYIVYVCVCFFSSHLQGFERWFADVSHVGSWLGGFERGLGSVGFGQRERVGPGDVRSGPGFSCCVLSIRQLVPLLLFGQLHAHTHKHTHRRQF